MNPTGQEPMDKLVDNTPKPLKLIAVDTGDLEVISAHLQDAVVLVGDMTYLPAEQRFAMVANRFDWQGAPARSDDKASYHRRRTGLHFDRVLSARTQSITAGARDAVVELLAISFEAGDAPSGHIDLIFAGGGTIRLEVECIDAQMRDLGPVWETASRPCHDLEE